MPYLEDSTPSETSTSTGSASTEDSVLSVNPIILHLVKYPLLLPQVLEVLEVQEGNSLKDMARYIHLTP